MQEFVMPHNSEQEASILATIMLRPEAIEVIGEDLLAQHFYINAHKEIFLAAKSLHARKLATDMPSIADYFSQDQEKLNRIGGLAFIASLVSGQIVLTDKLLKSYIQSLDNIRVNRQMIYAGNKLVELAQNGQLNGTELIEKADGLLNKIKCRKTDDYQRLGVVMRKRLEALEAQSGHAPVNVISTGFQDFDFFIGGSRPGQLILLAGRPGVCKTSLALNLALNATAAGKKVPFFSLEMTADELTDRTLSILSQVPGDKLRDSRLLNQDDWKSLTFAHSKADQYPFFIDSKTGLSVSGLRSTLRKVQIEQGLDMAVIDYLQLMKGERNQKRYETISEISRELKEIALELEIPIIALSQLSRKVEERNDHRPVMSDLRESGNLEQDADLVCLLYRPEVYPNCPDQDKGFVEVIIDKQRGGRTGSFRLGFQPECTRFFDYERF